MTFGQHPQQLKVLPEGEPARANVLRIADALGAEPPVPPNVEADFEASETAPASDVCGFPVGNGTCVMPTGHAGNHRLTLPEPEATAP